MNAFAAINSYSRISLESSVIGADPHKLISLLFHGALTAIETARQGILRKDPAGKGAAISKAMAIISDGLQDGLDIKAGGQLARNLHALYGYLTTRLIAANMHNDIAALDEVATLLGSISEAWDSIRPHALQGATPAFAAEGDKRAYACA